jgi:hypothetical protein
MDGFAGPTPEQLAQLGPHLASEVATLLGGGEGREGERLRFHLDRLPSRRPVYRVRAGADGEMRSLVIKQLDPDVAHRTRLLAQRWLPALELRKP